MKSCPRNSEIYTSASGTSSNHNHCFNAEPGKTYYLVVDGNDGTESNIYLTGIDGLPIILPVELLDFSATCVDNKSIEFEWNTASETYNDFFTIQHSIDGEKWKEVAQIEGAGHATSKNNYQYIDRNHYSTNINYFRLIQTDFDGTQEILKTISLVNCQTDNKAKILAVPNPNTGRFNIIIDPSSDLESLRLLDVFGRVITKFEIEEVNTSGEIEVNAKGTYIIQAIYKNGEVVTEKVIVE